VVLKLSQRKRKGVMGDIQGFMGDTGYDGFHEIAEKNVEGVRHPKIGIHLFTIEYMEDLYQHYRMDSIIQRLILSTYKNYLQQQKLFTTKNEA